MKRLKKIDYQILCKFLSKEISCQENIARNIKIPKNEQELAKVYIQDLQRIYDYFLQKRQKENRSIISKIKIFANCQKHKKNAKDEKYDPMEYMEYMD